jgi:hydrogenase maturation protease
MNSELVERIVQALLYEGYMLYPYRPSAIKNRQRWNFGVLKPQCFSEAQGATEPWMMQTECLVQIAKDARLNISVRFLQLVSEEAVERHISVTDQSVNELTILPRELPFQIPAEQQAIEGSVEVSSELIASEVLKLRTRVKNLTKVAAAGNRTRDEILPQSLISTHMILSVKDGEFVSLLEPPDGLRAAAAACQNIGCWPVLVGESGERDCMLSSPIILYDYPQVATESVGDFYDATEIDELLTLRVLTLTDDEKREMRSGDLRAKQVLERTEALPWEHLARVHGAIRGLAPVKDDNRD